MDDRIRNAIAVASDPSFHRSAQLARDWIERAINSQREPVPLLELQAEMAGAILSLQKQSAEFKAKLASTTSGEERKELSRAGLKARRAIRIVRDVGNGIAWRALNYDRVWIRTQSLKPPSGALEEASITTEIAAAIIYAKRTNRIIIANDLTDCLRFGDYTAVGPSDVIFGEVKSGRGSARSGHAKKQKKRTKRHLEFINAGMARAPDGRTAELLATKVEATSHVAKVADLLQKSEEEGSASARFSDCLAVHVVRPAVAVRQPRNGSSLLPPFESGPRSFATSTLELFDVWPANMAPLSVFPFRIDDRVALLTGEAIVVSVVDVDAIARSFEDRGLQVELPGDEELMAVAAKKPGEQARHELDAPIRITKPGSPAELSISFIPLSRISSEFLDEGSLAELFSQLLDDPTRAEGFIAPRFANEHELWD